LLIGQADWKLTANAQASVGVWGYTATFPYIDPSRPGGQRRGGVYGSVQGPLPFGDDWSGWIRLGLADPAVDVVDSYFGAGLVKQGPLRGRKDDQLGIAIARAGVAGPARRLQDLPEAETSIEATYRLAATETFALQPDVQYIVHPAGAPRLPNALVFGLRVVLTGQCPRNSADTED